MPPLVVDRDWSAGRDHSGHRGPPAHLELQQCPPSQTTAGFCMSGQVAIGRQFFPQRVVGDTVHSGMALGMPERPATTGPYKAIDRDHESRSRTEEG
jgi:hypothetical protein